MEPMNLKEDYCSYEISKLLKEKGFDGLCYTYYPRGVKDKYNISMLADNHNKHSETSRPTLQMAMKWLRDYPNYIFIGIENQYLFSYEVYHYHIRCNAPKREIDKISKVNYRTYEEAVEATLKYSLENLI